MTALFRVAVTDHLRHPVNPHRGVASSLESARDVVDWMLVVAEPRPDRECAQRLHDLRHQIRAATPPIELYDDVLRLTVTIDQDDDADPTTPRTTPSV